MSEQDVFYLVALFVLVGVILFQLRARDWP